MKSFLYLPRVHLFPGIVRLSAVRTAVSNSLALSALHHVSCSIIQHQNRQCQYPSCRAAETLEKCNVRVYFVEASSLGQDTVSRYDLRKYFVAASSSEQHTESRCNVRVYFVGVSSFGPINCS